MAEIISFERTEEEYIAQSALWSERGEHLKSLLYARKAVENGSFNSKVRLADSLYDSGNFEQACDVFLGLYFDGMKNAVVYNGLIMCFAAMSRMHPAAYFVKEGADSGILDFAGKNANDYADVERFIGELVYNYPCHSYSISCGKIIYPIKQMLLGNMTSFFSDVKVDENKRNELLEVAFSIVVSTGLDITHASKIVTACNNSLEKNPDHIEAIATKIQALVSLNRLDEAKDAAEELKSFEMSDDIIELIKCAMAMISVGDDEGTLDYLEEISFHSSEEAVLILTAIAYINSAAYSDAKETLSEIFRINPDNQIAKYWCRQLDNGIVPDRQPYKICLPESECNKRREKILSAFSYAMIYDGSMRSDDLRDCLIWGLTQADKDFRIYVGQSMARFGVYLDELKKALIKCDVDNGFKQEVMTELLLRYPDTVHNVFSGAPKRIKLPTEYAEIDCAPFVKRVIIAAYAALAINLDKPFEKKLYKTFVQYLPIFNKLCKKSEKNTNALATALIFVSNIGGLSKPESIVDFFGNVSVKSVKQFAQKIIEGEQENQQ